MSSNGKHNGNGHKAGNGKGFLSDTIGHPKKLAFLASYSELGNIKRACEESGASRSEHYRWLDEDPAYPDQFKEAHQAACEVLEAEARRRAVEGVKRLKFDKGLPIMVPDPNDETKMVPYVEHAYSDTLLMFLLNGGMPDKYRQRASVEHSGPGGGPIAIDVSELSDEELEVLRRVKQRHTALLAGPAGRGGN